MRKNNDLSITLIELVVILSILIVLVFGAILAYQPMRAKAWEMQERAIIASLQTAANTYYGKNLRWYGDNIPIGENVFDLLDSAPPNNFCDEPDFEPCPEDKRWTVNRLGCMSAGCIIWMIKCPHYYPWAGGTTRGSGWYYVIVPDSGSPDPLERDSAPGSIVQYFGPFH